MIASKQTRKLMGAHNYNEELRLLEEKATVEYEEYMEQCNEKRQS